MTNTHSKPVRSHTEHLEAYTAALLEGDSTRQDLLAQMEDISPALAGLARLSSRLHTALTPVEPAGDFAESLQERLEAIHARQSGAATRWQRLIRRTTRVSTRAGAAFSVLAVLTLAVRIVGSIVILAIFLSHRRRAQAASA